MTNNGGRRDQGWSLGKFLFGAAVVAGTAAVIAHSVSEANSNDTRNYEEQKYQVQELEDEEQVQENNESEYGKEEEKEKEERLKEMVKRNASRILNSIDPVLEKEEYPAPADHIGKGDLLFSTTSGSFSNPITTYHVVETKWIDYKGETLDNPTRDSVKERNRQKKRDVKEQADRYGKYWLKYHSGPVVSYAVINDENDVPVIYYGPIIWRE
ncbi:hypothetical protein HDV04_003920 [Boothiomyces sp. JEL0838]|nr:hypothetical protein HDV04_003920 [Boothiomyces sp. JEL0838]